MSIICVQGAVSIDQMTNSFKQLKSVKKIEAGEVSIHLTLGDMSAVVTTEHDDNAVIYVYVQCERDDEMPGTHIIATTCAGTQHQIEYESDLITIIAPHDRLMDVVARIIIEQIDGSNNIC